MDTIKSLRLTAVLFIILSTNLFSQQSDKNKFTSEIPTISGGAETSIMMEQAEKSGEINKFLYKNNKQPTELNGTAAVTPILGIDFATDAALSGSYHIPPDPIGAAGPSHLVAVNNTSIRWSDKDGSNAVSKRLGALGSDVSGSFFESLTPTTATFDPKVIYDQYNNRFVVVTLERSGSAVSDVSNISRILIAVSATSDPNGAWYFHAIDSKFTITGTDYWADYPGFAVSSDAIFVTASLFSFSGGAYTGGRLWIIQKGDGSGGFYDSGGTTSVQVYDPFTLSSGAISVTLQPTHMFGTPPSTPSNVVTYLVGYSAINNGSQQFIQVIVLTGTSASPSFAAPTFISLGDIDDLTNFNPFPNAPQLGTSNLILTNDRRTLQAVWRNDYLYCTQSIVPNSGTDAGQVTSHWAKFSAATSAAPTISDQGTYGGEDIATGTYTFMSSIAVNSDNSMVIGCAASASTIYAGAYYAGRISSDAAGTTPYTGVIKAGLDYYYRVFGGTRNRWGDYSGISVDPSDNKTFWVFNQYAETRGSTLGLYPSEDGRWGTAFGKIVDSPLPVELSAFSAKQISEGILVSWKTETEVNNYGFEIEKSEKSNVKSAAANQNVKWEIIGFVDGAGNSNSPKSYSFIDNNLENGNYSYRLKQIDLDGQFRYSDIAEIGVSSYPMEFALNQNYPNPFNPATSIDYSVVSNEFVSLKVFDVLGNEVADLVNEQQSPGNYKVNFNAENLSSGIYIYRLTSAGKTFSRKMLLLK